MQGTLGTQRVAEYFGAFLWEKAEIIVIKNY